MRMPLRQHVWDSKHHWTCAHTQAYKTRRHGGAPHVPVVDGAQGELADVDLLVAAILLPRVDLVRYTNQRVLIVRARILQERPLVLHLRSKTGSALKHAGCVPVRMVKRQNTPSSSPLLLAGTGPGAPLWRAKHMLTESLRPALCDPCRKDNHDLIMCTHHSEKGTSKGASPGRCRRRSCSMLCWVVGWVPDLLDRSNKKSST